MLKRLLTLMLVMVMLLCACNLPASSTSPDKELPAEAVIQTKAAQTVEAMGILLSSPAVKTPTPPPAATVPRTRSSRHTPPPGRLKTRPATRRHPGRRSPQA